MFNNAQVIKTDNQHRDGRLRFFRPNKHAENIPPNTKHSP